MQSAGFPIAIAFSNHDLRAARVGQTDWCLGGARGGGDKTHGPGSEGEGAGVILHHHFGHQAGPDWGW